LNKWKGEAVSTLYMSRREKIIISFMLLAVLFGGYYFFGISSEQEVINQDERISELNRFITEVAGKVNRKDNAESEYVLKKALVRWEKDPFLKTNLNNELLNKKEIGPVKAGIPLSYTGFLEAGNKMFAIINGLEYEPNDFIDYIGYKVKKITPENVVLETSAKDRIVLHLQE